MVVHQFQNVRFLIQTPKQIKSRIKVYYETRDFNERQEYWYKLETALVSISTTGFAKASTK